MPDRVLRDYGYEAAGHVWRVPRVRLVLLPDGSTGISEAEIERIHRAIANELCGDEGNLSFVELEFLCDVTSTSLSEVATVLGLHKSTVSKWRETSVLPGDVTSNALKRFFWHKLFGADLATTQIPIEATASDRSLLHYMHDRAIRAKLAAPVVRVAA